ncbi:hypothetical protein D3C78_1141560 [compost metagenome]
MASGTNTRLPALIWARLITWFRVTALPLSVSTPLLASWVMRMLVKLEESASLSFSGPVPSAPNNCWAVMVSAWSSAVLRWSFTASGASSRALTAMLSTALAGSLSASTRV